MSHVYEIDRARAARASKIIDTLDAAGFSSSMRGGGLADLAGKSIWIVVKDKPGRKGVEVSKVQIDAEGVVTVHGAERVKIAKAIVEVAQS